MFQVPPNDSFNIPPSGPETPSLAEEPLFIHRHCQKACSRNLLVFVHGLDGDRYGAWENFPKFIFECEPALRDLDIGMYAYVTGRRRLLFASIELDREARVMADILRDANEYDCIILVGHSMGGLLIKAAIAQLLERLDFSTIRRICGLFLLATPQLGSLLAKPIFAWLVPWLHKDLRALRPHGELVKKIFQDFQRHVIESDTLVAPGGAKFVIPVFAVVPVGDLWVDELSAGITISDKRRKDVRGSHTRVVKPKHLNEDAYRWVADRLADCFNQCRAKTFLSVPYVATENRLEALLSQYPPPLTTEVDPYEVLGVARTEYLDIYSDKGLSQPYIPRTRSDEKLDQALRKASRFVILTGRAKAGKSRTTFEAVRRNFPNHVLLVPSRRTEQNVLRDLLQAYEKMADTFPNAILWLDDLERYLLDDSFTVSLINRVLRIQRQMVVVATLRSKEFDNLMNVSGEVGRNMKDVLVRAIRVHLADFLTPNEKVVARKDYPNLNLDIPVGEAFVAAQELKARFDTGAESCPEGAAIVRAAIDCRRIGIIHPIPELWLSSLWAHYFRSIEPQGSILDYSFSEGLSWARKPVAHYAALLVTAVEQDNREGFSVPDYLVEHVEEKQELIPSQTWNLVLEQSTSGPEIHSVGFNAYQRGHPDLAKIAYSKGLELGYGPAAFSLGALLCQKENYDDAKEAYKQALVLGDGRAACNLGLLMQSTDDDYDRAKEIYKQGINLGDATSAFNLGSTLEHDGDRDGAKAAYRQGMDLGYGKAAFRLGALLAQEGNHDGVKEALKRGMELGCGEAAQSFGLLLHRDHNLDGAKAAYERGMNLGCGQAAHDFGVLLYQEGDRDGAKAAFQRGMNLGWGEAAHSLGALLDEDGDHEGASAAFETAGRLGVFGNHLFKYP